MKRIMSLMVVLVMMVALVGCSGNNTQENTKQDANSSTDTNTNTEDTNGEAVDEMLSGDVTISGSTSVEKIGNAESEEFMALNPDVAVTYESIGSSSGIKNANDGTTILGTSSRNLKEEEKAWGLTEQVIAYDGVAIITHPDNGVSGLSMDQILGIFTGTITNWSEVGGADQDIVVVSREDGSGTRGAFEELVGFEGALTDKALIAEGNGNVQTTVATNPQAIGYVSFTYINETVKALTVDGVQPTAEDVINGTYKISRPFIIVYHEENMTKESQAFVDFILSEEGQAIVTDNGGIAVSK